MPAHRWPTPPPHRSYAETHYWPSLSSISPFFQSQSAVFHNGLPYTDKAIVSGISDKESQCRFIRRILHTGATVGLIASLIIVLLSRFH